MAVPVLMPQMGESIAEGTLVRWLKKVGDSVDRDEPLFEISTDKVDAEIPSPAAGVLTAINVKEGELAAVNSTVAMIGDASEIGAAVPGPASPAVPAPSSAPSSAPAAENGVGKAAVPPASGETDQRLSPVVKRLAKEHNVAVAAIAGSGLGGRVTKQDLLSHIEKKPSGQALPSTASTTAATPVPRMDGDRVEPMSVMRKKIAEHMVMSRRTSAHVHTIFHVNFSTIDKLRNAKKAEYERAGVKLTYMSFIAKATLDALRKFPILNASIDGDGVVYRKDVNLGIAVALDNGLIVPVIRNANEKNVLGLARGIADVAARSRAKQLKPEEVQGGTFTLTNPGQFGAQCGFPIINQPQVAILCIGTVEKRAVVVDDAIAIRPMSYLTLGFDHRLIDGAVADEFMADVKRQLENFDSKDV